jgi:threonine dehydratase
MPQPCFDIAVANDNEIIVEFTGAVRFALVQSGIIQQERENSIGISGRLINRTLLISIGIDSVRCKRWNIKASGYPAAIVLWHCICLPLK